MGLPTVQLRIVRSKQGVERQEEDFALGIKDECRMCFNLRKQTGYSSQEICIMLLPICETETYISILYSINLFKICLLEISSLISSTVFHFWSQTVLTLLFHRLQFLVFLSSLFSYERVDVLLVILFDVILSLYVPWLLSESLVVITLCCKTHFKMPLNSWYFFGLRVLKFYR